MGALGTRVERVLGKPAFWALVVVLAFTIPLVQSLRQKLPPPLPHLGALPTFELRDQLNQPFGSAQLEGKVWIANFIFTRCPTICPVFTAKMASLQDRLRNLGPAVHLVSFSVDPEYDTPAILKVYADKHRASPRMWTFLTGDPVQIRKTVIDGLKTSMGREGPADDLMSIFHGTHFVLLDAHNTIRGFYASNNEAAVNALVRDVGLLVNRGD